ncbi:hypothetical protein KAR91_60005 [Candidatus Pacearchaeota archaeon]|nr:hypothetical protein [Candidatus Pacearchaeota archaeon]
MIEEAVDQWFKNKDSIKQKLSEKHVESYKDLVTIIIKNIAMDKYEPFCPDFDRIREIDDGDYQGTLVYVIAAKGYQPSKYYYVRVCYGSCSGCDTLQGINDDSNEVPTVEQVDEYMILALHIVEGLKVMGGDLI